LRMFFNFDPFAKRAPSAPVVRALLRKMCRRSYGPYRLGQVRQGELGSAPPGRKSRRPLGDVAVHGPAHAQVLVLEIICSCFRAALDRTNPIGCCHIRRRPISRR
jgi:hypothetical protein